MEKKEFISLIDRHLAGQTTELENSLIRNYLDSFQAGDAWNEATEGRKSVLLDSVHEQLISEITARKKQPAPVRWIRWAAAAAVIAAISLTTILLLQPASKNTPALTAQTVKDIRPGSKKAYVTLSNGQQVEIDNLKVGERVGDAVKTENGMLSYNGESSSPVVTINTFTVPRGAEPKQIELPDHTLVWLNSESSITYVTAFTGDNRTVQMTGEAYFEVAKNGKPFIVQTRTDRIEVMGTHFNINSYNDESLVKTTLLEGKVMIGHTVLAPDEQYANGKVTRIDAAAMQRVMAWKNGLFAYDKVDVQTLMRDLGRYYDVEVVFEGEATKRTFEGKIGRSLSLKEVLEGLQFTDLNYRLEKTTNRNRIVMLP